MNKEVGEKCALKHGFILNRRAARDTLPLCVTPPGITGRTSGRSIHRGIPLGCLLISSCLTFQAGTWQDRHAWGSADRSSQAMCFQLDLRLLPHACC